MGKNNTLTYFGLLGEKTPSTNLIWAFTTGDLTESGWLSEKAASVEDLTRRVKEGIEVHKRVLLAVPFLGTRTGDFEKFLKQKQKVDVLRIRVFDPDLKKVERNILLKGVTVGRIVPKGGNEKRVMYRECRLKVKDADWEAP